MSELVQSVRSTSDTIRALVVTRFFNFEGDLHFPRLGKEGRRLSNLLNSTDRKFLALTNVVAIDRAHGQHDGTRYPFIQVNLEAVEFIQPYQADAQGDEFSSNQPSVS